MASWRGGRLRYALLCALLAATGCVEQPVPTPTSPTLSLRPVDYASLAGWQADPVASMLPALLANCRRLAQLPMDAALGGAGEASSAGGKAGEWTPFCRAIQWVHDGDDAGARRVIAAWLQPYEVTDQAAPDQPGATAARFTGYFEPEYPGSLSRNAIDTVPVYGRPPDLRTVRGADGEPVTGRVSGGSIVPYWTRAQIDQGALAGKGLEILWVADPVDLFFMQVQGSGRIRLPSGQIVRLGYAGRNGAPYVPLGRMLVERGALTQDAVSMQSIRAWLAAHPSEMTALMEQNPNYVFFRLLDDLRADQGPQGALGVPLQPERSVAIDRTFLPLGAPVWVETTLPDGEALQHLMLAQDLGTDINGPARADIFFGWGDRAGRAAGAMHAAGRLVILLPRPPAHS